MVGIFLRLVFPISVVGAGVSTVLCSVTKVPVQINLPSIPAIVVSSQEPQKQTEISSTDMNSNSMSTSVETPATTLPTISPVTPEIIRQERTLNLKKEEVERGNCNIDESMKSILQSQLQREQDYYSITCTNVGINEVTDISFGNKWRGAFPKELFSSLDWSTSKKLEIQVKTEFPEDPADEDYPNKIKFLSSQFNNIKNFEITGDWNYKDDLDKENNTGAIVKLTVFSGLSNVYLLLDLDQKVDERHRLVNYL